MDLASRLAGAVLAALDEAPMDLRVNVAAAPIVATREMRMEPESAILRTIVVTNKTDVQALRKHGIDLAWAISDASARCLQMGIHPSNALGFALSKLGEHDLSLWDVHTRTWPDDGRLWLVVILAQRRLVGMACGPMFSEDELARILAAGWPA